MNIAIIGNCGSGKTWLTDRLSDLLSSSVISLDDIFWEPGGFNQKRPEDAILSMISEKKNSSPWIVEGVFGDLIQHFLDDVGLLIWLDIDWLTCEMRLRNRGSESAKYLDREQSNQQLEQLIIWGAAYYERNDPRSHSGHRSIVSKFSGDSITLNSEGDVELFLKNQAQQVAASDR